MFLRTQGTAVKEIEIEIRIFVPFKELHFWGRLLYPIAKLPREIKLTLRMEDIHEALQDYVTQLRARDDEETTTPLQFNPFKEISDLKHDVERILRPELEWDVHPQFCSGHLHAVGQELWTMLTCSFDADAKTCKLRWHCITNDRTLDFYTRVLKQVLGKLEIGPDADEQKRYLVSSWTLQHMMFTPMRLEMTRRYHTAVHKRPWMGSDLHRPRKRDWPFGGDACTPM